MHWENNNNKLCDLLYWDNHVTVVIWIPICSISEVNQYTIVCCSSFLYMFPSFILDLSFLFFWPKFSITFLLVLLVNSLSFSFSQKDFIFLYILEHISVYLEF